MSVSADMRLVPVCVLILQVFRQGASIGLVRPQKLNESLQIQTLNGLVQGSEHKTFNDKKTFFSYKGIPYARPPINSLRFKAPKRMPRWMGVLDGTREGPCCAGLEPSGLTSLELESTGQEDCLYLNLFTPIKKQDSHHQQPLAVMVYFYGGGFFSGCGNAYGPDFFMEENVVLVIPNFRISIFGYLSTEDLECPGNWASKDQIAVLKWIRLNVHRFGGDPKKVTIFGQSAGAANVNTLVLSPRAQDLFHRAILISGTSLAFWSYQLDPKKVAFDVGLALGLETNNSRILMDYLRSVDIEDLKRVQVPTILVNMARTLGDGLPLAAVKEPRHEDAVLTEYPYAALGNGSFNKVPVMIGVTSKEAAYFTRIIQLAQPLLGIFNLSPGSLVRIAKESRRRSEAAVKMFRHFFNSSDIGNAQEEDLIRLISEEAYYRPSRKTASFLSRHSPVYFYQLSYEGMAGFKYENRYSNLRKQQREKGVAHTEDLAYLFTFPEVVGLNLDASDFRMAKKITKLYGNFAKYGNPTPVRDATLDNITWPLVTPDTCPYIVLGDFLQVVLDSFDDKNFQFWERIYEQFADKPYKIY